MPEFEAERKAVLAHVNGFVGHLNQHGTRMAATDFAKLIEANFDHEGTPMFIGAAGASHGTAEIAKRFHAQFNSRFKNAKITMNVTGVHMIDARTAAVGGSCLVQDIRTLAGDPVKPLRSNSVTTLVNKGGKWVITSIAIVNETAKVDAPSHHG